MKAVELRSKNKEDLTKLLEEQLSRLAELNFDLAGGKVKNLKEIRQIKIDIARIKTVQNEIEN